MKQKNLSVNFLSPFSLHWNKKKTAVIALSLFIFSLVASLKPHIIVKAASPGNVIINEIAWAGSVDSSTDEWLEIYNPTSQPIDLTNWYFTKGTIATKYKILSGTIPSHGYFLIEDHESAVSSVTSDAIIALSLSNSGYSVKLYDNNDQMIDSVNGSGGAWPAGSATTKATMERVDPLTPGDTASNWTTSTGSGDQSSGNSTIIGTPKKINSTGSSQNPPTTSSQVNIQLSKASLQTGDILIATIQANSVTNLFAYGLDLSYDPAVLHFQNAAEQNFLNANNTVQTSFQAGLENGLPGKLVIAGARTNTIKNGVDGTGDLVTLQFNVIGSTTTTSTLHFDTKSFLANPSNDISTQFNDQTFTAQTLTQVAAVTNLVITEGAQRYSLSLSWNASPNATSYRVSRKDPHGQWKQLQQNSSLTFTDQDSIAGGGYIIPEQNYIYEVIALNGTTTSPPTQVTGKETRGLKGDNNRSDRVDGRDLEKLAQHFGETDNDQNFDKLSDTTYDGTIDGSDLIDIGANFAITFP